MGAMDCAEENRRCVGSRELAEKKMLACLCEYVHTCSEIRSAIDPLFLGEEESYMPDRVAGVVVESVND